MPTVPDDPRLTAHALGELEPEDRPAIEALLAEHPEARAFVADLQATAALLADHFRHEAGPQLDATRRRAIDARLGIKPGHRPSRRRWAAVAVAAGLLGLVAIPLLMTSGINPFAPARPILVLNDSGLARSPANPPSPVPSRWTTAPAPASQPPNAHSPVAFDRQQVPDAAAKPVPPPPTIKDASPNEMMARGELSQAAPAPATPALKPKPSLLAASATSAAPPRLKQEATPGQAGQGGRAYSNRKRALGRPDANLKPPAQAQLVEAESVKLAKSGAVARAAKVSGPPSSAKAKSGEPAVVEQLGPAVELGSSKTRRSETTLENPFLPISTVEASTFPIGCETGSYPAIRDSIDRGAWPARDGVRVEELVNYFPYAYPGPKGEDPFAVDVEVAGCPWATDHRLVRIGLKGRESDAEPRPGSNLVFLVETSASMRGPDRLPLLRAGMTHLVDDLGEADRVAVVVFADAEGLALPSTPGSRKGEILAVLDRLPEGGPTDSGKGLALAYEVAGQNFITGGSNRVLLATDDGRRLGGADSPELARLIESRRAAGVTLSVLAFGAGNLRNDRLERLVERGNGTYDYIDSVNLARQALVDQRAGTPGTIARDVTIQVRFNPIRASAYRLIGFENRPATPTAEAFRLLNGDEIQAGHCMTAFYEVVPRDRKSASLAIVQARGANPYSPPQPIAQAPTSKFSQGARPVAGLVEVDVSCKAPAGDAMRSYLCPAEDRGVEFAAASGDFKFAAAVAGFGLMLRDSPYKGSLTWSALVDLAGEAVGPNAAGYRKDFLELVRKAKALPPR